MLEGVAEVGSASNSRIGKACSFGLEHVCVPLKRGCGHYKFDEPSADTNPIMFFDGSLSTRTNMSSETASNAMLFSFRIRCIGFVKAKSEEQLS